jgi:hypothetical protein
MYDIEAEELKDLVSRNIHVLMVFAQDGQLDNLKIALETLPDEYGVDVKRDGKTSLMHGAENGHFLIVEYLVEEGASLDVVNDDGKTALMYASDNLHFSVVKYLIEKGASKEGLDVEAYKNWELRGKCKSDGPKGEGRERLPSLYPMDLILKGFTEEEREDFALREYLLGVYGGDTEEWVEKESWYEKVKDLSVTVKKKLAGKLEEEEKEQEKYFGR